MADDDGPALVSIIMPVKDPHPTYLAEALGSVRAQTSPRWRLLVVVEPEDREALAAVLGDWTHDPRVRLVTNEGARLAGAINTGMRQADTDFVALLLADDLWEPEAVAVLEDHITRYRNADFFHSARRLVDDTGQSISSVHPARTDLTLADFREGHPVKHLLCWRRSLGLEVGGLDERSRSIGPDDLDFPWTMAEHAAVFCPIDTCLYVYRDHRAGRRLTTHVPLAVQVRELRRIMRKHGMTRAEVRRRLRRERRSHLRQALYRSRVDATVRRWLRRDPPAWRDTYR